MTHQKLFCLLLLSMTNLSTLTEAATYARLEIEDKPSGINSLPIVLDLPFESLERRPTSFEKERAEENSIKARGYHGGNYPTLGTSPDHVRAVLLFHTAALFGEPTACGFMASFYEDGRYGVVRSTERAKLCRQNAVWWNISPEKAAAYARAKERAAALEKAAKSEKPSPIPGEGLCRRGVDRH